MYTQGVMIMEQQIDGCLAGARNFSSVGGDGQVGQVGGHGQLGGGGQDTIPFPVEKALASLELGPVSHVSPASPVSPVSPVLPAFPSHSSASSSFWNLLYSSSHHSI